MNPERINQFRIALCAAGVPADNEKAELIATLYVDFAKKGGKMKLTDVVKVKTDVESKYKGK